MITNDRRFGSDVIADMLELYDIPFASLNPGASYRGLHDSIVNYKGNRPEIIECPHEKVAVTLAHGYSRAAGKPMAAIVHNLVGLLHGTMGIYYAYTDQAPVLVLGASGPFDTTRRRPGIDWIHTSLDQGAVVREYTKWDDQPYNADSVPESVARAYRVATTPPMGPVYLCFDAALQEDELDHPIPLPNVSRLHTPEPIAGNPRAIERVAEMLLQAKHPVILADSLGRNPDSVARLVELAELMAAPVIDLGRRMNFPNQHPLCANGSNVLEEADLVIGLDCKALEAPLVRSNRVTRRNERIISDSCKVVDISLRDLNIKAWTHDFDKMLELDELVIADTSVAVPQLIDACRTLLSSRGSQEREERANRIHATHDAVWQRWQDQAKADWDLKPISTARLAGDVWDVIKDEDWVQCGGNVNGWTRRLWNYSQPYQFPGSGLGAGTGFSLSLGVGLAHRDDEKLVVSMGQDGDLCFDAAALWVATHHKIPMLMVMFNNRAYYNDWEHQETIARERGRAEENAFLGLEIDNPPPDFATLARAFSWYGDGPIEDPNAIKPAVEKALKVVKETGQPALVDVVCRPR